MDGGRERTGRMDGWMMVGCVGRWVDKDREGGTEEGTDKRRMGEWMAPWSLVEFQ